MGWVNERENEEGAKLWVCYQHLVKSQYMDSCALGEACRDEGGSFSLKPLFYCRTAYPEFMHPCSQGARVDPQDRRSSFLPVDTPLGFRKRLKNVLSFPFFQRLRVGPEWEVGVLQSIGQLQNRPRGHDHGPFNDTFQLPHVPGPRVILQGLHRLPRDRGDLFPQFPAISF